MAQNQNIGRNSIPINVDPRYILPILYMAITSHQIELENCSNPLKMGKVL